MSCAYIGHCQANGLGRWAVGKTGFSQESLEEHLAVVADLKAAFPDGPRKRKTKKKGPGQ